MYSVLTYGDMAADGVRMEAYARALARVVKPTSIVLDIGAGTGIFSLLAARAGAKRVHAVETNPAIWLLPELARANGLADRIQVHHGSSFELELEERADVIVSDLRGTVPLHGDHLAILRDARHRLLAPGGILMPERDVLHAALVEDDVIATSLAGGTVAFERRGFTAACARESILNTFMSDQGRLRSSDVVTSAAPWTTLEYGAPPKIIEGEVTLSATRSGRAHAIAIWFVSTTFGELGYANAPGSSMAYSRGVLPLLEPVDLVFGDVVRLVLRADEEGGRWAWDTRIEDAGGATKARFRQSTFFGMPTSPESLLRSSSSFAAVPSRRGTLVKRVLERMDGVRTVAEIAAAVRVADDPTPPATLLAEVTSIVAQYGR